MSDAMESTDDGWTRYYVKSSALLQRDLSVFRDESFADQVLSVEGHKRAADVRDGSGSVVMKALMKGLTSTKIEYTDADGGPIGTLKINSVLSKTYMELALAGGGAWTVVRDAGAKQRYAVLEGDLTLVQLDLTALALKRNYPVEVADDVDLPLAFGVVWAINFAHLQRVGAAGAAAG